MIEALGVVTLRRGWSFALPEDAFGIGSVAGWMLLLGTVADCWRGRV